MSAPGRERAEGGEQTLERVRGVGVVDHDGEPRAGDPLDAPRRRRRGRDARGDVGRIGPERPRGGRCEGDVLGVRRTHQRAA